MADEAAELERAFRERLDEMQRTAAQLPIIHQPAVIEQSTRWSVVPLLLSISALLLSISAVVLAVTR